MDRIEIKISLIIIALALLLILIFGFNPKVGIQEIVKDPSEFYIASGCVSQYYSFLQANDTNSLMTILDKEYIKNNDINESNVYEKLSGDSNLYTFNPLEAYKQKISENIIRYYIYGNKQIETIDDSKTIDVDKYVVTIYKTNSTYTIMPYTGNLFD